MPYKEVHTLLHGSVLNGKLSSLYFPNKVTFAHISDRVLLSC